jgi:2-haloalkanoic acid dehalogenase type II
MVPIDWITFDCYGTLIDWEDGVADALSPFMPRPVDRRALAARYIAVEAEVEQETYRPYREVLVEASGRLMAQLGHPLAAGHARVVPDSLPGWKPFPEVPDALRALRDAGYRLAILSNVDRDLIAASIPHLGIRLDLVVTAQDCRSYKPALGHWTHFQTETGAISARTVHVFASQYHDLVPAAALGYRTVFINRHEEPLGGVGPTRVLRDLGQLPATIAQLARE